MMKIPDIPADQDNRVNPLKAHDIHDRLLEEKNAPETNKKTTTKRHYTFSANLV